MRLRNRDLLTLLISLFIFSGCENPTGVGLNVDPEDQIDALFTDTVTLRAYTVKEDSVQSASFNQTMFGLFRDPVLGETNIGLAIDMARPMGDFKQIGGPEESEIDSVVLVIPYGGDYFGDTLNSSFSLRVRQLDEVYQPNTYSNKTWQVKNEVIGTAVMGQYHYRSGVSSDSLAIDRYSNGKDTTVMVGPQLRIPLSKEFFRGLLSASIDPEIFETGIGFRNHVKGLYLDVDPDQSTGIGGLVNFVPVSEVSGVELFYRQPKDDGDGGMDTIHTLLPIYPFSSSMGTYAGLASSVENTYSPEVIQQLNDAGQEFESIYLHAPTGLRGRVEFPFIDELKGKGLLINKAELVLYIDEDRMDGPFQPAPRLTMYREDIAGNRQNIPDGATVSTGGMPMDPRSLSYIGFGGWHNAETKRYIFHVTSYIQDMIQGKINGNELFIAPVSIFDQYVPTLPSLNAAGSAVIGGPDNPNYKMTLNLYYTETGNR